MCAVSRALPVITGECKGRPGDSMGADWATGQLYGTDLGFFRGATPTCPFMENGLWAVRCSGMGVYDDHATDTDRDQANGHHGSGVNG